MKRKGNYLIFENSKELYLLIENVKRKIIMENTSTILNFFYKTSLYNRLKKYITIKNNTSKLINMTIWRIPVKVYLNDNIFSMRIGKLRNMIYIATIQDDNTLDETSFFMEKVIYRTNEYIVKMYNRYYCKNVLNIDWDGILEFLNNLSFKNQIINTMIENINTIKTTCSNYENKFDLNTLKEKPNHTEYITPEWDSVKSDLKYLFPFITIETKDKGDIHMIDKAQVSIYINGYNIKTLSKDYIFELILSENPKTIDIHIYYSYKRNTLYIISFDFINSDPKNLYNVLSYLYALVYKKHSFKMIE